MLIQPILEGLLACAGLRLPALPSDTVWSATLSTAPILDGRVGDGEYGAPAVRLATAAGTVLIWVARHDDWLHLAALLPDSTFYWGDDFVVSLDPMGRGRQRPGPGDRQWYLRRVMDSSVVIEAEAGRWFADDRPPASLGGTRSQGDWDVASTTEPGAWAVELRIRLDAVKPGPAAPRITFRTFNDAPQGWWSWPAEPPGLQPGWMEFRPDLWAPLILP